MTEEEYAELELKRLAFHTERKRNYQQCFGNPIGQEVVRDLIVFCRAKETCVVPGDRDRTYVLEGRREVWLRIEDYLTLTPEDLREKYRPKP